MMPVMVSAIGAPFDPVTPAIAICTRSWFRRGSRLGTANAPRHSSAAPGSDVVVLLDVVVGDVDVVLGEVVDVDELVDVEVDVVVASVVVVEELVLVDVEVVVA